MIHGKIQDQKQKFMQLGISFKSLAGKAFEGMVY
jgi:hypothetical protein